MTSRDASRPRLRLQMVKSLIQSKWLDSLPCARRPRAKVSLSTPTDITQQLTMFAHDNLDLYVSRLQVILTGQVDTVAEMQRNRFLQEQTLQLQQQSDENQKQMLQMQEQLD
ncbi:hypothetical protein BGZ54_007007 [Gamsiella multidivaricata]|nr:hypothetical protein BGZ54_007007 [Gamsiella multidivaricata]